MLGKLLKFSKPRFPHGYKGVIILLWLVSGMQLLYVPLRKKNVLAKELDRRPPHKSGILKDYALQVSEIMRQPGSVHASVLVAEWASFLRIETKCSGHIAFWICTANPVYNLSSPKKAKKLLSRKFKVGLY